MLRLIRVELRRLLHRRAVLVLLAAAVLLPLAIAVGVAVDTRPPGDDEVAVATEQLERDLDSKQTQRQLRRCIEHPQEWGIAVNLGDAELREECEATALPQLDWYLWFQPLDLAEQRDEGSGILVALVVAMLLMVAGTTFAGHDWSSGSVANQVLFEPRRGRLWAAKAVALLVTSFVAAAVVHTGYWLGLNALAENRDQPHGGALLADCLQFGLRAAAVAAAAAILGFALTMLFRSTVATLGIVFGVALAGGMVLAVVGVSDLWNPAFNLWAVIANGATYAVEVSCPPPSASGELCYEDRVLSLTRGATYVGSVIVVAALGSVLSFRRRDIG